MKLPQLYKKYACYDDGKRSVSRRYSVLITDVYTWDDFDEYTQDNIRIELEDCDNLFKQEQEKFLIGVSYETDVPQIEIFAETLDGGWFGLGEYVTDYENGGMCFNSYYCSGRLILDEPID